MAKVGGRAAVPEEVRQAQGARLLALRKHLGLTQEQLAGPSGYKRADFSRFEQGDRLSSAEVRDRLALAFGISIADFKKFLLAEGAPTKQELEELARRRNEMIHGAFADVPAGDFLKKLREMPGLADWLEKNPSKYTLRQVAIAVGLYNGPEGTKPSSRIGDLQPHGGWGTYIDDAISGRLTTTLPGAVKDAVAIEALGLSASGRKRMRSASKK